MENATERLQDEAENDWEIEQEDTRVAGGEFEDEGSFSSEKVDEADMEIEEKRGESGDGRSEKRKKASCAGEKDEEHSVG